MDYLINIFIAGKSYLIVGVLVFGTGVFLSKRSAGAAKYKPALNTAATILVAMGLFVGLFSPSNTYKFEVDYNKAQDLEVQRRLNEFQIADKPEIKDIARKPASVEQRASNSIDMRNRINEQSDYRN